MILWSNKYNFFTIVAFSCLLLFSCSQKKEIPENIIPKEKMVQILADMYQTEAVLTNLDHKRGDNTLILKNTYLPIILKEYEVSSSDYDSSYTWYMSDKDEAINLIQSVKDSLEKRQQNEYLYIPKL